MHAPLRGLAGGSERGGERAGRALWAVAFLPRLLPRARSPVSTGRDPRPAPGSLPGGLSPGTAHHDTLGDPGPEKGPSEGPRERLQEKPRAAPPRLWRGSGHSLWLSLVTSGATLPAPQTRGHSHWGQWAVGKGPRGPPPHSLLLILCRDGSQRRDTCRPLRGPCVGCASNTGESPSHGLLVLPFPCFSVAGR